MAWESLPWDKRLLALTELSDDARGELTTLILALPRDEREMAVPPNRTVAVASLKKRLALAAAEAAAASARAADIAGRSNIPSAPLCGDASDGINDRPQHSARAATCDLLLIKTNKKGFVLLKGPPRSGKTSLLQLVMRRTLEAYQSPFSRVIYVTAAGIQKGQTWDELFEDRTGENWRLLTRSSGGGADPVSDHRPVLLLIDELQVLYGANSLALHSTLWGEIKRLSSATERDLRLRILAAAVFGDSPSSAVALDDTSISTPFEYGPEQVVGLRPRGQDEPALMLTTEEYNELWARLWRGQSLEVVLFTGDITKDAIFQVTAGQVGMIVAITDKLKEDIKQVTRMPQFNLDNAAGLADDLYMGMFRSGDVYDALKHVRSFLNLTEISECGMVRWTLFQRLLWEADGLSQGVAVSKLEPAEVSLLHNLHRRGYLHLTDNQKHYNFYTPLHLLYYQHQLLTARVQRVQVNVPDLVHFLVACIPRMLGAQLHNTLSIGLDGRILERQLQFCFAVAATSVLPRDHILSADVGRGFGAGGLVDFWVEPVHWAIELLRDGSDLSEHEKRFQAGGKYASMPFAKCAVLDFRSQPAAQPRQRKTESTYHIIFSGDHLAATLMHGSNRWPLKVLEGCSLFLP